MKEKISIEKLVNYEKPDVVLYCVSNSCFFTEKDLEMYCKNNNISTKKAYTIEYYKSFAFRSDVLKINGKYYAAVDEDGYGVFDSDKSIHHGEYLWNFEYGSLRTEYEFLKNIGIILEDDVYGKIDEKNKRGKEKCK